MALPGWFFRLQKQTFNRVSSAMARSGRGPFSLVRHVGRRTGAVHETPIVVARTDGGWVIELTWGDRVNWYRNLVAAGGGELVVHGTARPVGAPEPFPAEAGLRAFGFPAAALLRILRRREFRLLRERG